MDSLLPTSLQPYPQFQAIAKLTEEQFSGMNMEQILVYMVDQVNEDALYFLAKQFNVLGLYGYHYATTVEQKRALIKMAVEIHRYSGTRYAIRRALSAIGLEVNRIEEGIGQYAIHNGQYFYDGTITYGSLGHWAYFRVFLNVPQGGTISASQLTEAVALINAFKNVRSHLYDITLTTRTIQDTININEEITGEISGDLTSSFGAMYDGTYTHNGSLSYGNGISDDVFVGDYDASLFIRNAGITDLIIEDAIFDLVADLKTAGIWSKMTAIYPFVGGTGQAHKFNLKDARDRNESFRLNFVGGGSHTAAGYVPNGINSYAETYIVPTTHMNRLSSHISMNTPSTVASAGTQIGSIQSFTVMSIRGTMGAGVWRLFSSGSTFVTFDMGTPFNGLYLLNRVNSTQMQGWKNGTRLFNNTAASTTLTATPQMFIAASNNGTSPTSFSNMIMSFATVGQGLTDLEVTTLNNIITAFQAALGRS